MHRLGLIIVLLFCALCSGAQASKDVTDHAIAIDETGTLTLSSGTKARFVDIVFPDMALSTPWLATNVLQQNFAVQSVENDRYGRSLVTAEMIPAMLQAGIAVLFPQHPIPVAWIDAETNARQAKRGVWNAKDFVLSPENAAQHFLGFHVLEGKVTRLYKARTATYLNFGDHWQTDFSVTISGRHRREFDGMLQQIMPGTKVRVRGTIYRENGPMMRLTQPEQLELVH